MHRAGKELKRWSPHPMSNGEVSIEYNRIPVCLCSFLEPKFSLNLNSFKCNCAFLKGILSNVKLIALMELKSHLANIQFFFLKNGMEFPDDESSKPQRPPYLSWLR